VDLLLGIAYILAFLFQLLSWLFSLLTFLVSSVISFVSAFFSPTVFSGADFSNLNSFTTALMAIPLMSQILWALAALIYVLSGIFIIKHFAK